MAGYGDDAGFQAWLAANGYTLPGTPNEAARNTLRERGSNYIDATYGARFVGVPTAGVEQPRQWPRTGAVVYGSTLVDTLIPLRVVEASYYAAYFEALNPGSLAVILDPSKVVKREKLGPLETEYFEGKGDEYASFAPISSLIEGLLAPLLWVPQPAVLVV